MEISIERHLNVRNDAKHGEKRTFDPTLVAALFFQANKFSNTQNDKRLFFLSVGPLFASATVFQRFAHTKRTISQSEVINFVLR